MSRSDYIDKIDQAKYGRSHRSRKRTITIISLSAGLALCLLTLTVVSIYSSVRISDLNESKRSIEYQLIDKTNELAILNPEMEKVKNQLAEMVEKRFPNLIPLQTNQVIEIDKKYVKNVIFTTINQGNRSHYKYLLVMENDTVQKIKPSFRVLLFDEFGVHAATSEKLDTKVLLPGESRDYTAGIEFFYDTEPKHFYIDDLTAQENSKN